MPGSGLAITAPAAATLVSLAAERPSLRLLVRGATIVTGPPVGRETGLGQRLTPRQTDRGNMTVP
jgi:hypothetical protein